MATEDWAPTPLEVAKVVPAYTRGGFDDDSEAIDYAGEERGTFTATTNPSLAEVEELIDTAVDEVASRIDLLITEDLWTLARATAKWYVAMVISASKLSAGTDDAAGEFRAFQANYTAALGELDRAAQRRNIWVG
jgi:hypothetical protein